MATATVNLPKDFVLDEKINLPDGFVLDSPAEPPQPPTPVIGQAEALRPVAAGVAGTELVSEPIVEPTVEQFPPTPTALLQKTEFAPKKFKGFFDELKNALLRSTTRIAASGLEATERLAVESVFRPGVFSELAEPLREFSESAAVQPSTEAGVKGFVANAVGEALPFTAAAVASTLVTGNPLAPFVTAFVVEGEQARQDALRAGASEEDADLEAFVVGTINGALEKMQVDAILDLTGVGRASIRALVKAAKEKAIGKLARETGKLTLSTAKTAITEGLQEALQETTSIVAPAITGRPLQETGKARRIGQAFLGGAVVGPLLGGAGGIVTGLQDIPSADIQTISEQIKELEKQKPRRITLKEVPKVKPLKPRKEMPHVQIDKERGAAPRTRPGQIEAQPRVRPAEDQAAVQERRAAEPQVRVSPRVEKAKGAVPTEAAPVAKEGVVKVYHGTTDLGDVIELETGKKPADSGAVFFTESKKYAKQYAKEPDQVRGLYETELDISKVFDISNPEHIKKLIDNWYDPSLYDSRTDAIKDAKRAISLMKDSVRLGAIDWATGSQYLEQIERAGFEGMRFLERPGETIEKLPTGGFKVSGPPVYSYAMLGDKYRVTKAVVPTPTEPRVAKEGKVKDLVKVGFKFEAGGAPYEVTRILPDGGVVTKRTDKKMEPTVFAKGAIEAILEHEKLQAPKPPTVAKPRIRVRAILAPEQTGTEKTPVVQKQVSDVVETDFTKVTSARQAAIAEDRKSLGLEEINSKSRRSWNEALKQAKTDKIPLKASRIAGEINENPRPLTDIETAGLTIRMTELKSEHEFLMKEIGKSKDNVDIKTKSVEAQRIETEFDTLTRAVDTSGTEKGRALAAQKLTINKDFSLVAVLNRAKTAAGKALTGVQRKAFKAMTSKLNEVVKKIEALTREVQEIKAKGLVRRGAKRFGQLSRAQKDIELNNLVTRTSQLLKAGCNN